MIVASIIMFCILVILWIILHINFYRIQYFNIRKLLKGRSNPPKIGKYYDKWKKEYCEFYGEIIQAHRSEDIGEMLDYIMKSSLIKEGEKLLDAGCGYCEPATFFAKNFQQIHIDAITISQEQVNHSLEKIKKYRLEEKVKVQVADFHFPEKYFAENTYDMVYFLESYGHATKQVSVLKKAVRMLKPGGRIYIKDYFMSERFYNLKYKHIMRKSVRNMNREYRYNLPDLYQTIYTLRRNGMELVFIKKPTFSWNQGTTVIDFEKKNQIDLFKGMETIRNIDVYEMLFIKEQ